MTPSEVHRQFYLQAAGIRLWYAKKPLPGAAPSPEFWFPEEEPAPTPVDDRLPMAPARGSEPPKKPKGSEPRRSVDLKSLMADSKDKEVGQKEVSPQSDTRPVAESLVSSNATKDDASAFDQRPLVTPVSPAPNAAATVQANANLAIWSSERYLLVSHWSDEASEGLQESLASNLLKALGENLSGPRRSFQWPVFRNSNIPGNSVDDMRQALARCLSAYQGKSVVLLGDFTDPSSSSGIESLQILENSTSLNFPHSLAELASAPEYKRQLWERLKAEFLR